MIGEIKYKKEIVLGDEKYVAYLKEVATKLGDGGMPQRSTVRAFVKKVNEPLV